MKKRFDRTYFDRWYRGRSAVISPAELRTKVELAVSVTEYFLRRQIRNVIDIGCGEAAWFEPLRSIRPDVGYAGFDPSDYAVERFGKSRNVSRGSFGELPELRIRERFDLLVCADVLHYLHNDEVVRGLPAAVRLMRGVAFLEVITREDFVTGDTRGLQRRPAKWYRDLFRGAGLAAVGPFLWIGPALRKRSSPLEIPTQPL